jgi:thioredoxin reductase
LIEGVKVSELPVVVIGAGPQGLAAAAHLVERGIEPVVLESGTRPAAAVAEWGHVRLFSEWPELVDGAAGRLLASAGWSAPNSGYPTGGAWIELYLAPLAAALGDRVQYGARVVGVGRKGRDLLVDAGRAEQPFVVHVRRNDGSEDRVEARAVLDASGTWRMPSPAGADGLPALGEAAAADFLLYRIPDFADAARFAGRHTVVVGAGHSASTAIIELARVAKEAPGTKVTWVLRRGNVSNVFGGGDADQLPARGTLSTRAREAVESGRVDLVTGFRVNRIDTRAEGVVLMAADGRSLPAASTIVVLTGFRPDLSFLSEMRLDLDARLQAPVRVAEQVDPNVHSCGTVSATGAADLAQPEPGLFLLGAKSYGRAPTFLAMTGYEQVRSVVAELADDHEAAARVELKLPDTGVCGGAGLFGEEGASCDTSAAGASCCVPVVQLVQIGKAPAGA